jgi:hypothetical protein
LERETEENKGKRIEKNKKWEASKFIFFPQ